MAMYMIFGDGSLPKKEAVATLTDLFEKSQEADAEFWFTLQGKAEPTDTDKAVVEWLVANEVYYEVLTDDADTLDAIYADRQETHVAKRTAQKAVNLLKAAAEEDAALLALFVNTQEDDPADGLVLDVLQAALDAEIPCFALNDSMSQIQVEPEGGANPEPDEEESNVVPMKKPAKAAAPAKKAAKKAAPAAERATPEAHTREELAELTDPEIRAIGQSLGVTTRGRANWINKILEAQSGGATEIEEEPIEPDEVTAPEPEADVEPEEDVIEVQEAVAVAATNGSLVGPVVVVINPATSSVIVKPLTEEMAALIAAD